MQMAEEIEVGNIVAFMMEDPDTDGYYVAEVDEGVHTLQEDLELNDYNLLVVIAAGEMFWNTKNLEQTSGHRTVLLPWLS